MNKFEKVKKEFKNELLVLVIIEVVVFSIYFIIGDLSHDKNYIFYNNIYMLVLALLMFINFIFVSKNFKFAGFFGIFIGFLMFFTLLNDDLINMPLSALIFYFSFAYLKSFKFKKTK